MTVITFSFLWKVSSNGHFGQSWLWWPSASQEVWSSCMYSARSTCSCGAGWRPTTAWSSCRTARTQPRGRRRAALAPWAWTPRTLGRCLRCRQGPPHGHPRRPAPPSSYPCDGPAEACHPESSLSLQTTEVILSSHPLSSLRLLTHLFLLCSKGKKKTPNDQDPMKQSQV